MFERFFRTGPSGQAAIGRLLRGTGREWRWTCLLGQVGSAAYAIPLRSSLAALLLAVAACTSQSAVHGEGAGRPESPEEAVAPRCVEAPAGALLDLQGSPCAWVLLAGEELDLRSLDEGGPRLRGAAPTPCDPGGGGCRWDGALSPLGPVLIAAVPGGEGETPGDVWLGAALGGERLAFTRLWWGGPSRVDRSDAGAIWELTPWRCGERLILRPHGRVAEAAALGGPPPELRAAAGAYAVVDGELRRSGDDPGDAGCERIAVDLP